MRVFIELTFFGVGAEAKSTSLLVYAVILLYASVFGYFGFRWALTLRRREVIMSRSDRWRLVPFGVAVILAVAYLITSINIENFGQLPLTQGGAAMANPIQVFVMLIMIISLALYWWWAPRMNSGKMSSD